MGSDQRTDWQPLLYPLKLGDEPLAVQLRRSRGILLVVTVLGLGISGFLLAIFTAFGQGRIGIGMACAGGLLLVNPWWQYGRLHQTLSRYEQSEGEDQIPR